MWRSPRRIAVILYLRRIVVLLLFVLAPLPVAATPAWACDCAINVDPLRTSELAFVGVVVDVDPHWTGGEVDVEFAVDSVVQGSAGDTVTLVTAEHSASCGYEFVEGSRYRVYASHSQTTSCAGNELLATGVGTGSTRTAWVWPILAVALVVMAGAVIWLVRRSRRNP